jgi:hypothetical protein
MSINPFRPKFRKQKPKQDKVLGDGRVRLANKSELRMQVAERADYRCEAIVEGRVCNRFAPLEGRVGERGELAHKEHGEGFRSDTMESCLWKCHNCHQVIEHGTPKYPRRPGKVMRIKDAKEYWEGDICFCSEPDKIMPKPRGVSFCGYCTDKLDPQTAYDLEHLQGDEYRLTLADAENQILMYVKGQNGQ